MVIVTLVWKGLDAVIQQFLRAKDENASKQYLVSRPNPNTYTYYLVTMPLPPQNQLATIELLDRLRFFVIIALWPLPDRDSIKLAASQVVLSLMSQAWEHVSEVEIRVESTVFR